jgi:putative ABC transport system permease protein
MFSNYTKLALRHLSRNWRYLTINVLGLGFALGFCVLSFLNYRFAHSYNHWHRDSGRVFRVTTVKETNHDNYAVCPAALAEAVGNRPELEAVCRYDSREMVVKQGENVFTEFLHFADGHFFQFFDFELLAGTANLHDREAVVIDEETAVKYFGEKTPIGKTLQFYANTDHQRSLTVSGVLKTIRMNSSLRFRCITHLDNQLDNGKPVDYRNWRYFADAVFLKLKNPADAPKVQEALQVLAPQHQMALPDWKLKAFELMPIREIALRARDLRWENLWHGLPAAAVWGNVTMAILLLLTAVLNFINMTIAICNRRLREMGVRKVMGGTRGQLIGQLLGEAGAVVVLATALGCILAYPVCNWFNATWEFTDFRPDFTDPQLLGYIAAMMVATTLLAGSYPAFYLSAFRPASIFRGGILFGGRNLFTRLMMGVQVGISIACVIVGLSFAHNARKNYQADIGYNYRPIIQAFLPSPRDYAKFADAVRTIPGVSEVKGSLHLPGFGANNIAIQWQGTQTDCALYQVGNGFPEFMEMHLTEGHWPASSGDSASTEVVVNEAFRREIAGNAPLVGTTVEFNKRLRRVSGVVRDFMNGSPFQPIRPSMIHPVPERFFQRVLIKTNDEAQLPAVMAGVEKQWKTLFPYAPLDVGYQSAVLHKATVISNNVAQSMGVFSGVAILLTITGLFSLVSLNVLRRLREVAIRRVMGASSGHVTWILNKNYLWIFGIAVASGCLGGRVLAIKLMDSIFKINHGVQLSTLVAGTIGVLVIATFTIGIKVWQTLRTNPADVLRGE